MTGSEVQMVEKQRFSGDTVLYKTTVGTCHYLIYLKLYLRAVLPSVLRRLCIHCWFVITDLGFLSAGGFTGALHWVYFCWIYFCITHVSTIWAGPLFSLKNIDTPLSLVSRPTPTTHQWQPVHVCVGFSVWAVNCATRECVCGTVWDVQSVCVRWPWMGALSARLRKWNQFSSWQAIHQLLPLCVCLCVSERCWRTNSKKRLHRRERRATL